LDEIKVSIDYDAITALFRKAHEEGRNFLFEHEVYKLLRHSGAETPPRAFLLERGMRPTEEELGSIPGEKVVLKIVSSAIVHKSDVGGVRIIPNEPVKILSTWRRMLYEVPEAYADLIERNPSIAPPRYLGLRGDALLGAISRDILGVLLVQYMPPDTEEFGNELFVGIRRTREFGMVISAGLGGTDTELYAERFRKGQAVVVASTVMTDGDTFLELFRNTISYKKLAGLTRSRRRVVTDEQLVECFLSFIEMGNTYSPENPEAEFIIDELEINPFAFTDYLMVPLDGLCRFSLPEGRALARPIHKIGKLLHPTSIGIVGVSPSRMNFGRVIINNIIKAGFDKGKMVIVHPKEKEIDGVRCIPDLSRLKKKLDLFVVAVGAEMVPMLVQEIIERDASDSVILIPGGMGEKAGTEQRAMAVAETINAAHKRGDGGPVFLGGNCMGVVSRPGRYDTWFIPEEKLPKAGKSDGRRAAFISQSGAFMLTRLSQCPSLDPAYMISVGNQTDLTLGDLVHYVKDLPDVDVIAVYAEGFKDLDGLAFCKAVRRAVLEGKEVVFYKAGRTPEGKTATSGHTASLAGDYTVCESCVRQAGAIVVQSFTQFEDLFFLAERFHEKKILGNRLAAMSGAGFEAVGIADSIQSDDYSMQLAPLEKRTEQRLAEIFRTENLAELVTIKNPLDMTPGADDETHVLAVEALARDRNVDAVVVGLDPLSPVMRTLSDPGSPAFDLEDERGIVRLLEKSLPRLDKPVVGIVDGGRLFDSLTDKLRDVGVCVFRTADRAVAAIALYIEGRLNMEKIRRRYGKTC